MFEVRTKSPFDDRWQERDREIRAAANRPGDSGAGFGMRDHLFQCDTFEDATLLKGKLMQIPEVNVTIRES